MRVQTIHTKIHLNLVVIFTSNRVYPEQKQQQQLFHFKIRFSKFHCIHVTYNTTFCSSDKRKNAKLLCCCYGCYKQRARFGKYTDLRMGNDTYNACLPTTIIPKNKQKNISHIATPFVYFVFIFQWFLLYINLFLN